MSHDETIEQATQVLAGLVPGEPWPTRDEIEDTICNALREQFSTYGDAADAVLALLKGQDK